MTNRPDIELALDVRSNESVVVLFDPDFESQYPDEWIRVRSRHDIDSITPESVVIVDRLEVSRRVLASVAARAPRLIALVPHGVDQEKSMRRTLSGLYPWSEVWTISTAFGKALVTKDAVGPTYERDDVMDMRPSGEA